MVVQEYGMIRRRGPWIAFWIVLLGCLGYLIQQAMEFAVPPAEGGAQSEAPGAFSSPWQDETQLVVIRICTDLTEMAYLASQQRGLGPDFRVRVRVVDGSVQAPSYEVSAKLPDGREVKHLLTISRGIWNPTLYQDWWRALALPCRAAARGNSGEIVEALIEPTPQALVSWDRKLSGQAPGGLLDPGWHDEAALLLGSLALREPSGYFFQIRHELCRMTAHLAMSDSLRGSEPPSLCHQLACATLACLYRREDVAMGLLKKLPDQGAGGAWKRALTMRMSRDYRAVGGDSLLEARERFVAEYTVGSCAGAWKHRPTRSDWKDLADWTRFAGTEMIAHNDVPVGQLARQLVQTDLPAEVRETGQVWEGEGWGKPSIDALNTPPQGCVTGEPDRPTVQVLGKGTWGAFCQRQLCHTLVSDFRLLEENLGDLQGARAYADSTASQYSRLVLYPFVLRELAGSESIYKQNQEDAGKIIRSKPEIVPSHAWNRLFRKMDDYAKFTPPSIRVVNQWFLHNPLPGTAYDLAPRHIQPSFSDRKDFLEKLSALQSASPHDPTIYSVYLRALKEKGLEDPVHTRAILEPLASYNADAAFRMAVDVAEGPEIEKWQRRASQLNTRYFQLVLAKGPTPGEEGRFEEEFNRWLKTEPEAEDVAKVAQPMVLIYEKSGRKPAASDLADRVAIPESWLGLCVKADLLERRGQREAALALYARSDQVAPLLGGLLRAAAADPKKYQGRLQKVVEETVGELRRFQPPATLGCRTGACW